MQGNEELALTFTVEEWRWITAACATARAGSFINGEKIKPELIKIAKRIAKETGK